MVEFPKEEYWKNVGKYSLGNFAYGFSSWLIREINKEKYDHIFFLSRDGYIMQLAAERMATEEFLKKSSYLYVSRRSLIVPTLHLYDGYEQRVNVMSWKKHFTIRDFIEEFGLNFSVYYEHISSIVPNVDTVFERDTLKDSIQLINVYRCLEKQITENSKREYELIIAYFRQEGFSDGSKLAIVTICKSANLAVDIRGYYIGIRDECKYFENQKMKGFLYFGKERGEYQRIERLATSIIETFFACDTGSVRCYEERNHSIVPVLKENSKTGKKSEALQILHNSALARIEQLKTITSVDIQNYDPMVYFYGFKRIALEPTQYDAWEVALFVEEDEIHGTAYYLLHPNRIKKDIHKLEWKLGQLKRVLRLRIDYLNLYNKLDC